MQTASRKVGEFLVNRKVLSKDSLEYALDKEAETGVPWPKSSPQKVWSAKETWWPRLQTS